MILQGADLRVRLLSRLNLRTKSSVGRWVMSRYALGEGWIRDDEGAGQAILASAAPRHK